MVPAVVTLMIEIGICCTQNHLASINFVLHMSVDLPLKYGSLIGDLKLVGEAVLDSDDYLPVRQRRLS